MSDKDKTPMDPTAPEGVATARPARERNTYGMGELISEVEFLFPGIAYEVSNRNPRGVAFDVQFDTSTVLPEDRSAFKELIFLAASDPRVGDVVMDSESVLISFVNNPRIMDLRDEFGLAGAWAILRADSGQVVLNENDDFVLDIGESL